QTLSDKPKSNLHDALTHFYQQYYSANLMVGVIYGNHSFPELSEMAVNSFGRIANRKAEVPEITVPAVTDKQTGLIIHYVPAQPQRTLNIEFRIANNSQAFRSKTDTYISYLLGNRSHNTLANWLQKQGLADGVNAGADPMQNRNGGVFVISISLTDKGMEQRDRVIGAVFNYIDLLRTKGVDKRYFDEIAKVLALDFRYPSITRDMNYIEWLVDMMIRVPYQYVLDAPYLADQYDPAAIEQRLQQMTPEQARIWFISPNEPHNKVAYFVNAPYEVEKIPVKRFALWQQLAKGEVLNLPALNPYIPTDFSLEETESNVKKPEIVLDRPDLRVYYMPSNYFADDPKADIEFALRTPYAQQNARQQVEFALLDYLAGVSLDQLSYQASVGGINFSTGASNGLRFSASGFTQHLPTLLSAMVEGYRHFTPTEQQLQQAKSWYQEKLDAAEQGKAFELAMQPVQSLSYVPYTERQARREQLAQITLKDLLDYRDQLFQKATPELLVVGNMSVVEVKALAEKLKLQSGASGGQLWHGQNVIVKDPFQGTFYQRGSSTDAALAALYLPLGYNEIAGMAYSNLLEQIAQPLFYDQLRSKEQLGYAVFAFSANVGRQWGICFLLQSSNRSPAYLFHRYQAFFPLLEKQLQQMGEEEFNRYKQALITQLQERPQTLDEEVQRLLPDFARGNVNFDHRSQLIEQLGKVNQADLLRFYQAAVIKPQGLTLLSQVIGKEAAQSGYITPAGWSQVPNASTLQQRLPVEIVR
ncbi:MAG: pitrilysin, partial [Enterobacteriaceae bacterium]